MRSLDSYRPEFPVTERYIYLDHSGVAPISRRVVKAIEQYVSKVACGAMFHYVQWVQKVSEVRINAARLINADVDEIAFVKNTSHGLSIIADGLDWNKGDNMIIYEKEFPSNQYPWINLKNKGVEVRVITSENGRIEAEAIERLIDSKTRLVSLSSVQFTNGFKVDLKSVGALCRGKGVFLCVDAIQSLGVIPMDVKDFNIDFLSADGHKWLLSPEGTGIFYCKKGLPERINPPLIGWKSVKKDLEFENIDFDLKTDALRFEEASMNIMGIYALGGALDLLFEVGINRIQDKVLDLGDMVIEKAEKSGFKVMTPRNRDERGGIVTIVGNFDPKTVKNELEKMNIMVNVRAGGLRVSPHFYNTENDVISLFEGLDDLLM